MSAELAEQEVLFDAESDEALFADGPTLRKRYTATQVPAIEAKRDLIYLCFAAGMPVKVIAAAAKVNVRTVQALVSQAASAVAEDQSRLAPMLRQFGAKCAAMFMARIEEAKPSELAVAAGIFIQRGNEIGLLSGGAEEKVLAMDAAADDVRERVLRMLQKPASEMTNDETKMSKPEAKGEPCP